MRKTRLGRFLSTLHAWSGAIVATFLLLVALSGIAIAFASNLLNWETDAFPQTAKRLQSNPVAIDVLIAKAKETADPKFLPLGYLGPHAEIATNVEMVYGLSAPPNAGGEVQIVTFAPAENTVLGKLYLDRTLTHALIDFHYQLLMGSAGGVALAIVGLIATALSLVGIYLAIPNLTAVASNMRRIGSATGSRKRSFTLHSFFGVWFSAIAITWCLTGTFWSQPTWQPSVFTPTTESLPPAELSKLENSECAGSVSIEEAIRSALERHPGTTLLEAEFAAPWQPYHIIYLASDSDVDKRDGDVRVWASSRCRGNSYSAIVTGPESIGASIASIHSGETFGGFRITMILIAGAVLSLLSITGLIVWSRRYLPKLF